MQSNVLVNGVQKKVRHSVLLCLLLLLPIQLFAESGDFFITDGLTVHFDEEKGSWFQVQLIDDTRIQCQGDDKCTVPKAGAYRVLNFTTGARSESVELSNGSTTTDRSITGGTPVPTLVQVAKDSSGFISVIWQTNSYDGVNVYRNNEYVTTVSSGNVYNDYSGREGDYYYLVGVRDGQFSSKSRKLSAAGLAQPLSASIELRPVDDYIIDAVVRIHLTPITVTVTSRRIYRKNSGGAFDSAHQGTYLGSISSSQEEFIDSNVVPGASYGVINVRGDGTLMPMVNVYPDYQGEAPLIARNIFVAVVKAGRTVIQRCLSSVSSTFSCFSDVETTGEGISDIYEDGQNGPGSSVGAGIGNALEDNGFQVESTGSYGGIGEDGQGNIVSTTYTNGDTTMTIAHANESGELGRVEIDSEFRDENGQTEYKNTTVFYEENPSTNIPEAVGSITTSNYYDASTGNRVEVETNRSGHIPDDVDPPANNNNNNNNNNGGGGGDDSDYVDPADKHEPRSPSGGDCSDHGSCA